MSSCDNFNCTRCCPTNSPSAPAPSLPSIMSTPASVFSSPSTYVRPPPIDDAMKQTPRSRASPFSTKYYTPSSLDRNSNLMKSLSSAMSSTPRSIKKAHVFHTPKSVASQLAWHHHSTPQSQVKNPFEIALVNQLQSSLVSPGIFAISSTPNREDTNFHWTIDQLAVLHPVEFEDKPSQGCSLFSPAHEEKAQKAIDKYFATHIIVPSPAEESVRVDKNEKCSQSSEPKKTAEVECQTTLTLPQNVDLYDLLGEYMTYKDKKQDGDSANVDSFSTSSLRRKLFAQGYHEDSFASNKESAKSEDDSNSEDELPAPIPSTPDWDRRRYTMDPLSSSPVNRRSRRFMTNSAFGDSFVGSHSSPNFSPIVGGPPSSPLSSRSQPHGRNGSYNYLEDSRKQLFSSLDSSSPVLALDDSPERNPNLIDESKMDMSTISLKTPTSSPTSRKLSDSTGVILNASLFKMSPLFSSVKKELQLINPNANWSLDSEGDVSLASPMENSKSFFDDPNVYSICEQLEVSLCAGDAPRERSCSMDQTEAINVQNNNNNNTDNITDKSNNNAINDLQNITSSMSANFSLIPSKLEVTNVDNSRYVSNLQHDTGYMSYNTTGSMPSRSEISQCSKSAFSIYNTSTTQDVPESMTDTAKLLSEKAFLGVPQPQPKTLCFKAPSLTTLADSLLDYEEVVDRARQILTLTSKFCTGPSENPQAVETDADKSTDQLQWQPLGASTPTHKGRHKPASETAAEILQKAQEDLNKLSQDNAIHSYQTELHSA